MIRNFQERSLHNFLGFFLFIFRNHKISISGNQGLTGHATEHVQKLSRSN